MLFLKLDLLTLEIDNCHSLILGHFHHIEFHVRYLLI